MFKEFSRFRGARVEPVFSGLNWVAPLVEVVLGSFLVWYFWTHPNEVEGTPLWVIPKIAAAAMVLIVISVVVGYFNSAFSARWAVNLLFFVAVLILAGVMVGYVGAFKMITQVPDVATGFFHGVTVSITSVLTLGFVGAGVSAWHLLRRRGEQPTW